MKISIITVCYNSVRTIGDAMESVRRQTGVDIDYIVVDGGSTDGTVEEIKNCELRIANEGKRNFGFRWVSERDRGMYDAINKGVAMATGDVIGILNADDRLEDERVLADVVRAFSADSSIQATYGDVRFVRGEGTETVRYYSSGYWKRWMHRWGYMPAHPSVYVRKEVFGKYGGYKLGYDISADFEWIVRTLCRARIRAQYLPRCMVTMRLGGRSTSGLRAMLKLNRECVRANRENGYFCSLAMMVPKYFYKILALLIWRTARRTVQVHRQSGIISVH